MSFTDKFDSLEERFNALARAASETSSWDAEEVRRESDRYARSRSQQGERRSSKQSERRSTQGAPSGERRRKERGNPLGRFALWLVCVVVVSFLLAEVGWLLMNDLCAFNKPELTVTLTVEKDDSISTVAKKLHDEGLIDYKWFFKLYAAVSNAEEKIGEGEHTLTSDMDYHALISNMKNSSGGSLSAETVRVTIPEGYTVAQTIALLAEKKVNTVEALTEAAESYAFDYDFLNGAESGDISRLEGFLFPDTYDFYVGEKPSSALSKLMANFDLKMNEELLAAVNESGYSLREIITVASLIEEETDGTDQKRIASVIYNRIQNPSAETVGLL
ncbi:MAG: endolytic transglycosylase MltG [Oscillospiraceae bacterium]|nr:endolytic transglycosylase MltG [Oscillospiraceae bacterium]